MDLLATLRDLPLFEVLPEDVISRLAERFHTHSLSKGEALFHQGDPGDAFIVVAEGRVRIVEEAQGRVVEELNELGAGDSLGQMTLVTQEPRTAGAIAITPLQILVLDHNDFINVVGDLPVETIEQLREISGALRLRYTNLLKQIPFLANLPDDSVTELSGRLERLHLAPGDVLFSKGDVGHSLYIIEDGWVKIVTHDAAGEELILNQVGPGEAIGEISLLEDAPRTAGVIATEPSTLLQLDRDSFMEVIRSNPQVSLDIMRTLSHRLRFASLYIEQVIDISKKIAEGDYSFAKGQIESSRSTLSGIEKSDERRIHELLAAFFSMVEGVQKREEELKEQVRRLTIQINQSQRHEEVESITSSEFFADLKENARRLREEDD